MGGVPVPGASLAGYGLLGMCTRICKSLPVDALGDTSRLR
jgi:hypothetical protein